jgi:hypothetical protein
MYGNGCAGSTASGVSTGKIRCSNAAMRCCRSCVVEIGPVDHDAAAASSAGRAVEHGFLIEHELVGRGRDLGELRLRRQAVGRRRGDAGGHLVLERGDAHLEELVEVADEQMAQNFSRSSSGMPTSAGQRQHALVERQPAQFTVEQALRHATTLPTAARFSR